MKPATVDDLKEISKSWNLGHTDDELSKIKGLMLYFYFVLEFYDPFIMINRNPRLL